MYFNYTNIQLRKGTSAEIMLKPGNCSFLVKSNLKKGIFIICLQDTVTAQEPRVY